VPLLSPDASIHSTRPHPIYVGSRAQFAPVLLRKSVAALSKHVCCLSPFDALTLGGKGLYRTASRKLVNVNLVCRAILVTYGYSWFLTVLLIAA